MKKLMIAAAIVCAAALSQAATIAWTSNGKQLTDGDGNPIKELTSGSLALVVMSTATDWANAKEITIGSDWEQTTLSINQNDNASLKGRVTGTVKFAYDKENTAGNLINNGDYLALMFKDEKGALSQLVYTGGPDDGDPVAATWKVADLDNNSTGLTGKAIGMSGNFAAAVPEPTSGLLLLLGIGAMALRRRRA